MSHRVDPAALMPAISKRGADGDAGEKQRADPGHDAGIRVDRPDRDGSRPGQLAMIPARRTSPRLGFIDSIRGLAALSIIAFHLYYLPTPHLPISDGLLQCISRLGTGVPLFFIISGLTLCLSESRRKHSSYIAFLTRRLFRIFPLYLVALSIMLALGEFYWHRGFPSWGEMLLYVSLMFNLAPRHVDGLVWASWSLSVEVIFYLFFPLLFRQVRLGYHRKIAFLLCTLVLSAVARAIIVPVAVSCSGGNDHYSYFSVFNHLPFFAAGICLYARWFENPEPRKSVKPPVPSVAWLTGFVLLYSYSTPAIIDAVYIRGIGLICFGLNRFAVARSAASGA